MKIQKTMFLIEGEKSFGFMDTISYEGKLWLVPEWLEVRSEGLQKPVRMICLDTLKHYKTTGTGASADYSLASPIPKSVLDGHYKATHFVVIEAPEVYIQTPLLH